MFNWVSGKDEEEENEERRVSNKGRKRERRGIVGEEKEEELRSRHQWHKRPYCFFFKRSLSKILKLYKTNQMRKMGDVQYKRNFHLCVQIFCRQCSFN